MITVHYAISARNDLKAIYTFIGADSVSYAKSFVAALRQQIAVLKMHPEYGRPFYPERFSELRQVLYKPYRIIYHYSASQITVITIHHQSRLPENIGSLEDFTQ